MIANDPSIWGKSPIVSIDDLVQAALAKASKFQDETPYTALMCIMGTQGLLDHNLYQQAESKIRQILSVPVGAQMPLL